MIESKNQKVRGLVASGDYRSALKICKDWDYKDKEDRQTLRLGYEVLIRPEFYKQIGKDPEICYDKAVSVLKRVFS